MTGVVSITSSDDQRLHVERLHIASEVVSVILGDGDRRPVIFLHGNSSTKAVWANQLAAVHCRRHAVAALDLPGHGDSANSSQQERTYSLPGYAGIVSALLDVLQWNCVDVVGWSLGGHVGLQLLATDERIGSLLIVGTPPVPLCGDSLTRAFYPSGVMELASKSHFSIDDAVAYGTAMMGGRELLTPELLRCVVRTDGAARAHFFASALRGTGVDQKQLAETVDKPLCVVHGEKEPFVRLEYLRALRYRALWNERIFVVSGAGHAPHWQCPSAFNAILLAFLGCQELIQPGRKSLLHAAERLDHNCGA